MKTSVSKEEIALARAFLHGNLMEKDLRHELKGHQDAAIIEALKLELKIERDENRRLAEDMMGAMEEITQLQAKLKKRGLENWKKVRA